MDKFLTNRSGRDLGKIGKRCKASGLKIGDVVRVKPKRYEQS